LILYGLSFLRVAAGQAIMALAEPAQVSEPSIRGLERFMEKDTSSHDCFR
jgi:hypothetical protein